MYSLKNISLHLYLLRCYSKIKVRKICQKKTFANYDTAYVQLENTKQNGVFKIQI